MTITEKSQASLLYDTFDNLSNQTALVDLSTPTPKSVTYKDLYSLVDCYESFLKAKGISAGNRIVLCGRNSIPLVAALLACWRRQVIAIPVDCRMTAAELANIVQRVEANLLLAAKEIITEELTEKLKDKEELIQSLEDGQSQEVSKKDEQTTADFDALVILTSGTTGMPKGALHTFHSLVKNLDELSSLVNMGSDKRLILPLPVSHIFGLEVLLITLLSRGQVIFCDLDPKSFTGAINEYSPQIIAGVPTIYGALLALGKSKVNLEKAEVLLSGGAPLPIPMAEQFETEFNKRLNNGYGSTESKIICLNLDGPVQAVGKPIPSVKIRILDDEGKEKSEGEDGEIYIDSNLLMKEYLSQPEKTTEALTEHGYKTGDIGHLKDDYLFISGRAKEMIIVAGNKVFPIEVEQVLEKCTLVKEVAITGQDHKRLGQIVKASIVINDQEESKHLISSDQDEVKECRARLLAKLKDYSKSSLKRELRPMIWDLRPINQPLPKTRSGKVDKKSL